MTAKKLSYLVVSFALALALSSPVLAQGEGRAKGRGQGVGNAAARILDAAGATVSGGQGLSPGLAKQNSLPPGLR